MKDFASDRLLVLVVDEKQEILEQVTSALTDANYATNCCTTVQAALAMAEETSPDLIICATSFNGESGLELCERIKQHPGLETVPVMFLSGGQIPDIIRRHDASGGTYYLRKPFDPNVLVELADKAMHSSILVAANTSD